jgi:hypothetical protein
MDQPLPIPTTVVTMLTFKQYVATLPTWEQHRSSFWFLISTCLPLLIVLSPNPTNLSRSSLFLMVPTLQRPCPLVGDLLFVMALGLSIALARASAPGLHTVLKAMAFYLQSDLSTASSLSFLLLILGQPASRPTIWVLSPTLTKASPMTLFMPTGAQLIIHDQLITGHFPSRICEAATGPELIGYLRNRNHWTQREWQSMDLLTLKAAITKHSQYHVNVVKFIHDKLPMATIRQ